MTVEGESETAPPAAPTLHAPMAEGRRVAGGVRERMEREDDADERIDQPVRGPIEARTEAAESMSRARG
jgi:hypothetical protein